ncbi:Nucleotide-binding oligomerization domain-containing protein 1 [Liparis tanakae]|uniref:Nucleotide-binding oligomerization domain-containing protein 1 n=1 Tax=Liparis tanakae TaxID=230148 RepID=A0A4Z2IJQ1_9TELE|nr:Nucleotide-binding oligomerization domain-containing protein 1 [Liparis tanakae]
MDQKEEAKAPCLSMLTSHRERLVTGLRSIQCILDNLLACAFLCEEDVEIVQRSATKTDKAINGFVMQQLGC